MPEVAAQTFSENTWTPATRKESFISEKWYWLLHKNFNTDSNHSLEKAMCVVCV
jgi:hypothetical protein